MARIGDRIIKIPAGVTVEVDGNLITVKGPKGTNTQQLNSMVSVKVEDGTVKTINNHPGLKKYEAMHGTANALINNMIEGVVNGYEKHLEIKGVGYRVAQTGANLTFSLGFSHPVVVEIPSNLSVTVLTQTELKINGIDKQAVSQFAAEIKANKEPEPYGGKGIRYKGQHIRQKAGKTAGKKK